VARTFPTTVAGEAQVPGRADLAGFAVACAMVTRLRAPGRVAVAAYDAPRPVAVDALLEEADRLGVAVVAEEWGTGAAPLDASEHLDRLTRALWSPGTTVLAVATDPGQWSMMEDVAGPVVAWRGGGPAR
jgi:hypothetical protein